MKGIWVSVLALALAWSALFAGVVSFGPGLVLEEPEPVQGQVSVFAYGARSNTTAFGVSGAGGVIGMNLGMEFSDGAALGIEDVKAIGAAEGFIVDWNVIEGSLYVSLWNILPMQPDGPLLSVHWPSGAAAELPLDVWGEANEEPIDWDGGGAAHAARVGSDALACGGETTVGGCTTCVIDAWCGPRSSFGCDSAQYDVFEAIGKGFCTQELCVGDGPFTCPIDCPACVCKTWGCGAEG